MKYIKIRLEKGPSGIIYPPAFHNTKLQGGGYLDDKETGKSHMLLWGDEHSANNYLGHPAVTELTKEEAMAFSEANERRILKVTDQGVLELIKVKAAMGTPLTDEENSAINPDDKAVGGIERTEIMADEIKNH